MPLETRSRTNINKPLTPALSSNLRARPNFAPRLAGGGPTSPATASQRSLRQQTLSPERNETERTISLNSNITPRSGARASRVDTDSPSTPDTSTRTRNLIIGTQEDAQTHNENSSFGITSPLPTPTHTRPKSSDQLSMLPTARRVSGGSNISQSKDDSKFFRADDVKANVVPARTNTSRPKSAYIPGLQSPRSPKKNASEAPGRLDDKFFHASNVSAQITPRPRTYLDTKLSGSSAASSTRSLPIQTSNLQQTIVRSPNQTSTSKAGPSNTSPTSRQRATSNSNSAKSPLDRRRSSSLNIRPILISNNSGHRKSLSTSSASVTPNKTDTSSDPTRTPRSAHILSDNKTSATITESPISSSPQSASLISAQTSDTSVAQGSVKKECQPPIRPPLHARHTRGSSESTQMLPITQAQIEAAANARRERKVLDLEISNSSLLAINRTLEKELRKQNAELRRFRRLSRSGRLSLTPSQRIVSGASMSTLTTLDEDDQDSTQITLSPSSSDGGSYDDDYPSNEDDNDSAFTESSDVLRRRARDEKRLLQDLQRHQQILLDSQKLTQSIQRCLNSTDELIRDGTKALAYQVEVNDVQIGGRVLTHDDDEALSEVDFSEYTQSMSQPRQGLLSPIDSMDDIEEASRWDEALPTIQSRNMLSKIPEFERNGTPSPTLSPIILPER